MGKNEKAGLDLLLAARWQDNAGAEIAGKTCAMEAALAPIQILKVQTEAWYTDQRASNENLKKADPPYHQALLGPRLRRVPDWQRDQQPCAPRNSGASGAGGLQEALMRDWPRRVI